MSRNLGRGKPKKSAGDVLLVAVEGKTEEDYFSALRRRYRIPDSGSWFTMWGMGLLPRWVGS